MWVIAAISISSMSEKMALMTPDQQQLFMLLKSARSHEVIDYINRALEQSVEPKHLESMRAQLVKILQSFRAADLYDLLQTKSSPENNAFLWRSLTAKQLVPLVFNDDAARSINNDLLINCNPQQIKDISRMLNTQDKHEFETAQLQI